MSEASKKWEPVAWFRSTALGGVCWRPGGTATLEDGAPLYTAPPVPVLPEPFAYVGDYSACGGTLSLVRGDNDDRMCKVTPVYSAEHLQALPLALLEKLAAPWGVQEHGIGFDRYDATEDLRAFLASLKKA